MPHERTVRRAAALLQATAAFLLLLPQGLEGFSAPLPAIQRQGRGVRAAPPGRLAPAMASSLNTGSKADMDPTASAMAARAAGLAAQKASRQYGRWWVFPLAPFADKKTFQYEVVKDQVWCFEQKFGALYVQVPIRMTVVRLQEGLLVYAPISPTREVVNMVRELEQMHGSVKHVVLPSAAIEHKTAAGPFARNFPKSQLWVTPNQYSFPFGLENFGLLGFTQLFWFLNPKPLPLDSKDAPWVQEMDHTILGPLKSKGGDAPGLFEEAVFLHKASKTLLVADTVQSVPTQIPDVLTYDPTPLVFHARDDALDTVQDSQEVRKRGWERISLFALFFQPGGVNIVPWGDAFPEARKSPMKDIGWNGLFPFAWRPKAGPHPKNKRYYKESFDAIKEKLFVPAVLQKLIFDREPATVLAFADRVAKWDFRRIIPAHMKRDIAAKPQDFRRAFSFLEGGGRNDYAGNLEALPLCGDASFLEDVSASLVELGSVAEPDPMVEAYREERRRKAGITNKPPSDSNDGWGLFRN